MTPEQFQSLLKKYRQGLCSAEEQKFIEEWYDSIETTHNPSLTPADEEALKKRYWLNVSGHIRSTAPLRKHTLIPWRSLSIAASVVFATTTYLYFQSDPKPDTIRDISVIAAEPQMKLINNDDAVAKDVVLPEGSVITLQPGGRISYAELFNKPAREVYLEGEAFFQVRRDETRPFLVHTKEVTTKVLGTSFTIKARPEDKSITVAVRTGKVSVYTHHDHSKNSDGTSETILTPNQQVVYNRKENKVSRMLVENPEALVPVEEVKKLYFEEASVAEIFTALEKVYGVDIVFDEKLLSSCTLTTSISDGTIYNRLDIICKALGTTYTVEETQIIISGAGCN